MAKTYGKKAHPFQYGHRVQLDRPLSKRKKTSSDESRVGEKKKKISLVSLALVRKGLSLVLAGTTPVGVGLVPLGGINILLTPRTSTLGKAYCKLYKTVQNLCTQKDMKSTTIPPIGNHIPRKGRANPFIKERSCATNQVNKNSKYQSHGRRGEFCGDLALMSWGSRWRWRRPWSYPQRRTD